MSKLGGCDVVTDDDTATDDVDDALEKNDSDDGALCVTTGRSMMRVGSANVGLLAEHALSPRVITRTAPVVMSVCDRMKMERDDAS
jgi:hypothetical protein